MDAAAQVDLLAKRLDNDDLTSVIKYMNFLINEKETQKAKNSQDILLTIQNMFNDNKGWASEDDMIADMADFRKKRMHE